MERTQSGGGEGTLEGPGGQQTLDLRVFDGQGGEAPTVIAANAEFLSHSEFSDERDRRRAQRKEPAGGLVGELRHTPSSSSPSAGAARASGSTSPV